MGLPLANMSLHELCAWLCFLLCVVCVIKKERSDLPEVSENSGILDLAH